MDGFEVAEGEGAGVALPEGVAEALAEAEGDELGVDVG